MADEKYKRNINFINLKDYLRIIIAFLNYLIYNKLIIRIN